MRCFVCAGTHSSKLFEFEFECCTVRLGDSPRKPFHNLFLRLSNLLSFTFRSSFPFSFLPHHRVLVSTGRTPSSLSVSFFAPSSPPPPSRPSVLPRSSRLVSFPLSRPYALSLPKVRFLEPPSLNPNPKVHRSAAFLGFDSCYRAKLPPQ